MRIFNKKHTWYTQEFILSPVENKFREMYESATEPFYHLQQKKKATTTTLEHVMHLFEEKNKYAPLQVSGPLPIKANGAIVVNRPSQHTNDLYLRDYDKDHAIKEVLEEAEESNSINEEQKERMDVLEHVHKENNRLRQQILLEREQNEKWRIAKEHFEEELEYSKHTIRNLQRTADRFQKMLSTSLNHRVQTLQNDNATIKRLRRQSTGTDVFQYHQLYQDSASSSLAVSYERKLQILLNEIEAMDQEQLQSLSKIALQKLECNKLKRKLKYKDDIIRQLAYELQFERNSHLVTLNK